MTGVRVTRRLGGVRWRTGVALLALAVLSGACAPSDGRASGIAQPAQKDGLVGHLLVAARDMPDPRFAETVIFVIRHDRNGAMGLVVNRQIGVGSAHRLLGDKGTTASGSRDDKVRVHYGGPVEPRRGFVLHSAEYADETTFAVTDRVSITAAPDFLRAVAEGKGPKHAFLAIGYAGWAPGQLEAEIARKDWVVVPADDGLLFDADQADKWRRAMGRHGIEL